MAAVRACLRPFPLVLALGVLACSEGSPAPTMPPPLATPVGNLLLYDPTGPIHVVEAASGEGREVSRFGEPFMWVSASLGSDGHVALGGSTGVGQPDRGIRQLDLRSGNVTTLISSVDRTVLFAAARLSPDGTTLALTGIGITAPGRVSTVTMDLDSGVQTLKFIAPAEAPNQYLADLQWLPDQSGLIAIEYGIDSAWVVHFELASGTITRLTEAMPTARGILTLDLAPDGETIAYNTPEGHLRFMKRSGEPAGGFPADLVGRFPTFSPDGTMLAWSLAPGVDMEVTGVWFHRFADGKEWPLTPANGRLTWVLDWE